MDSDGRREFIGSLVGVAAGLGAAEAAGEPASLQAAPEREPAPREARVIAALRELNEAAGIGISEDELERAGAYASGAFIEAAARLRPIVLDTRIEPALTFAARRRP